MISRFNLRGRKAILDFFGLSDWKAIMRKKNAGAPVIKEPDGTWVACSEELDAWSKGKQKSA